MLSNCLNCKIPLTRKYSQVKFCGKSCSAKYNNKLRVITDAHKEKTSKTLFLRKFNEGLKFKRNPINRNFILTCISCKKDFEWHLKRKTCSQSCLDKINLASSSKGGKKAATTLKNNRHRSFNEKAMFNLVKQEFSDAINNVFMFKGFDADIIIPSLKLCIHWNGEWHYNPVISLDHFKRIRSRDIKRYKAIKKCGYKNYIIKDLSNYKSVNIAKKEFIKLKAWLARGGGN